MSDHLKMLLERQHFVLGYFKTLSVGPLWVRTHDLLHGSLILDQLSHPTVYRLSIDPHNDQLPVGLIAQLERSGQGSSPFQA